MKKLNEDIIRKLIIETLEEQFVDEGRKKAVEEVEDGVNPSDYDARTAGGSDSRDADRDPESEPQPQDFGLDPKRFSAAVEAVNSGNDITKVGGWSVLEKIADAIKKIIKNNDINKNSL